MIRVNIFIVVTINALIESWCTEMYAINTPKYVKDFYKVGPISNTLCDLPKEKKLAICNTYLRWYKTKIIYFNKVAAHESTPDCVKNSVKIDGFQVEQDMFPCYGRHETTRTDWNVDDFFDYIYLSGGALNGSVVVYEHVKSHISDTYRVHEVIMNYDINTAQPLFINRDEVVEELKLLQSVTFNSYTDEVETIYMREVLKTEVKLLSIEDQICDLDILKKISLCKQIYREYYDDMSSNAVIYDHEVPMDCEEKRLHFQHVCGNANREIKRNMFSCRPTKNSHNILNRWRLSTGPRKNSIIVFDEENSKCAFKMLVENLNINDLQPAIVPDTETENVPKHKKKHFINRSAEFFRRIF